ncbi:hypothetical protein [Paenibacillus bouchesdurhonensis]|uniref:hypothetical protein n=1 Tax=Paenibacillus bouchesdurhonensis TaxID=1870990 RepID=UPI000DA63829|nr:hypothetical protein [Paenibacillus bouchesdurhonensis]
MEYTVIISIVAAVSGIILGWMGRTRTLKQDVAQEASADGMLRADVGYIKHGIDDVRSEQRQQGKKFDLLSERVTRVEESAKQAHKRLDDLQIK